MGFWIATGLFSGLVVVLLLLATFASALVLPSSFKTNANNGRRYTKYLRCREHALPAMMSASTGGKVDGINGESGERVAPRVSCWCALMTTWMVCFYVFDQARQHWYLYR